MTFRALPSDVLEITVRDKFAANRPAISHFLGRVKVPLSDFLQYRGAKYVHECDDPYLVKRVIMYVHVSI